MSRPACAKCGSFLRSSNPGPLCWPCEPVDVPAAQSLRRRTWTLEEVIEAIQRWTAFMGRGPRKHEWEGSFAGAPEHPSPDTVYRHFATWPEALAAAGVESPVPSRSERRAVVMASLPARAAEVSTRSGLTLAGARSMLNRMRKEGLVAIDGSGVWSPVVVCNECHLAPLAPYNASGVCGACTVALSRRRQDEWLASRQKEEAA